MLTIELLADNLPQPVDQKREQDPGQQGPEEHQHHQQHPRGNGSSLREGLGPIGHEAPAGKQGHRDQRAELVPSKARLLSHGHGGMPKELARPALAAGLMAGKPPPAVGPGLEAGWHRRPGPLPR